MSSPPNLPQSMGAPSILTCESQTLPGSQGILIAITPVNQDNSKLSISEQENSDKEDTKSVKSEQHVTKYGIFERIFAKPKYNVLAELWGEINKNLQSERDKNSQLTSECEKFKGEVERCTIALVKCEAEKDSLKAENMILEKRLKEASESNNISRLILEKIETINVKGVLDKSNETSLRARFNKISQLGCENIYSQSTEVAGVIWKIGLVKIGDNLRIFLHGSNENAAKWSCSVYTKFLLISQKSEDVVHTHCTKKPDSFDENKADWGYSKFISFKDLYNEEKGFVKDDSILVAVVFKVFPAN